MSSQQVPPASEQTDGGRLPADQDTMFRTLAEHAVDPVFSLVDDRWQWISPSVTEVLGWTADCLVGTSPLDLCHADDLSALVGLRDRVHAGHPARGVCRLRTSDGRFAWILISMRPLVDESGRTIGVGSLREINLRVESERALVESERQYRLLAENTSDFVMRTSPDGTIEWVSESVRRVLGWQPEQLVGHSAYEYVHPSIADDVRRNGEFVAAGNDFTGRGQVRCADGSFRWLDQFVRPLLDEHGVVVAKVSGFRDVEAQVEVEERVIASERRYRMLAENSSDVVYQRDMDGIVLWISPSVSAELGWPPGSLVGTNITDLVHPDDLPRVFETRRIVATGHEHTNVQCRFRCADGTYRHFTAVTRPVVDEHGVVTSAIVGLRDIDEVWRARQTAEEGRVRLVALMDAQLDPNVLMAAVRDDDGRIVDLEYVEVNEAAVSALHRSRAELIGRRIMRADMPEVERVLAGHCFDVIENGRAVALDNYDFAPGTPAVAGQRFDIRVARCGDGIALTWRDVTERYRAMQALDRQARHDALTGLLTREEVLQRMAVGRTRPRQPGVQTAVLFCDVDHFKSINDEFGHAVGDLVLRVLAERISSTIRTEDIAARIGGDELLVILNGLHDQSEAIAVAEKIRTVCAEPIGIPGGRVEATLSIGVTLATVADDVDALLARADDAMYRAKAVGRNRVVAIGAG